MGKDKYEQEKARGVSAKTTPRAETKGKLVTFSPTKEHKEMLRTEALVLEDALSLLQTYCEDGVRVSSGYNADQRGFFLIIREGRSDWRDAVSVSFWGSSLDRVLVLAAFYLTHVCPEFPHGVQPPLFEDDW